MDKAKIDSKGLGSEQLLLPMYAYKWMARRVIPAIRPMDHVYSVQDVLSKAIKQSHGGRFQYWQERIFSSIFLTIAVFGIFVYIPRSSGSIHDVPPAKQHVHLLDSAVLEIDA